jgi:hypothetical protein
MKFFYFYCQFQLFSYSQLNNKPLDKILLGSFYQTLGVKINVFLKDTCTFNQTNIKGEEITKCKFYKEFQDKKIFDLIKSQNTEVTNLLQKITVTKFSSSIIQFQQIDNVNENNKQEIQNLSTINLYGFLKIINNLKIFEGYQPDYYQLSMEKKTSSPTRDFHEIYYRLNGANKKHTENSYINDSRNYTMGNILGVFGNPIFIFLSGKGEETFLYIGVHECEKKRLTSFMLIQFDLYGKVMKYFHHIPLCAKCHKNSSFPETSMKIKKDKY